MQKKIIIVDDSNLERILLSGLLQKEYSVIELDSGDKCLPILLENRAAVSAILLDIMMPRMNGFEVLEQLKGSQIFKQIPIIVITGDSDEDAQIKALSLGANAFITKPFNQNLLLQMLRNTIQLCETAALANSLRKDKLTGLYNRESFLMEANVIIAQSRPGTLVLSCVNIERFKVINDLYGVCKGDAVLKHVANCIDTSIAQYGGICCRFSADNFAVLYPQNIDSTKKFISLYDTALRPDCLEGYTLKLRIGRCSINDATLSSASAMDRAILAQESIKGRYDKHIADYCETLRDTMLHEQQVVSNARAALDSNEFEPWFQPQYNHKTGALIGSEALVRWRKPNNKFIPPNSFIPIFERNGFVYELDKYIWERVCQLLYKWLKEGHTVLPISVNISRFDIINDDFLSTITGLIKKYEIPIDLLRLEVTESAFSESPELIVIAVKNLIAEGFTVEIDDFGSGYSSLNTLKDVPANVLKLDMKFLQKSGNDLSKRSGIIVESIVHMAKKLAMSVIAEGVETKEQADYLESIGCFYIQGYYYSKPLPLEEYEKLIADSKGEHELAIFTTVDHLLYDSVSLEKS